MKLGSFSGLLLRQIMQKQTSFILSAVEPLNLFLGGWDAVNRQSRNVGF